MTEERFRKGEFAAWIGIVGNIVLAFVKGAIGLISNSKALLADAANSASDVVGSVAVLIGLKAAKRPPDEDHPYGHGKAEPIAAIIVSILLIFVGLQIGYSSARSIVTGVSEAPGWIALVAILISIVVKEALFQYKIRLGKKISSQALIVNAWDHRSDVYSSVAALLGVGGALIGELWNWTWMFYLDPIAGIVVSLLIVIMGYRLVMESIHNTMDHVLHPEETAELIEAVKGVVGVITVDDLRAREHGHYVIVDLKISVNPRITVQEGHDIAKNVKQRLMKKFAHITDVLVHVNPYDPGYPYNSDSDAARSAHPTILH